MTFGQDGSLYVAEGGTGGTNSTGAICVQVPAPAGPYTGGATARISRIDSKGNRTTLAGGGCSHGNPTLPNGIVGVDTHTGAWKYVTDLSVFNAEHRRPIPIAAISKRTANLTA